MKMFLDGQKIREEKTAGIGKTPESGSLSAVNQIFKDSETFSGEHTSSIRLKCQSSSPFPLFKLFIFIFTILTRNNLHTVPASCGFSLSESK